MIPACQSTLLTATACLAWAWSLHFGSATDAIQVVHVGQHAHAHAPPADTGAVDVAGASRAPALTLTIIGPGSSPTNPAYGLRVVLSIGCGGTATTTINSSTSTSCPPWVRVDRTDGVADTSPYETVAEQVDLFDWAPTFPLFYKPEWGPVRFEFDGAPDNRPVPLTASGWTAQYNGSRLTANSSVATVYYNVGFRETQFGDLKIQKFG